MNDSMTSFLEKTWLSLKAIGLVLFAFPAFGMKLSSIDIQHHQIGMAQVCARLGGLNQAPKLMVTDVPSKAGFLSLVVDDQDANDYIHWNLLNIPKKKWHVQITELSNGEMLKAYHGMCPPSGLHHYFFEVFATHKQVLVDRPITRADFIQIAQEQRVLIIDKAILEAYF